MSLMLRSSPRGQDTIMTPQGVPRLDPSLDEEEGEAGARMAVDWRSAPMQGAVGDDRKFMAEEQEGAQGGAAHGASD